jgi:hypothetical protein
MGADDVNCSLFLWCLHSPPGFFIGKILAAKRISSLKVEWRDITSNHNISSYPGTQKTAVWLVSSARGNVVKNRLPTICNGLIFDGARAPFEFNTSFADDLLVFNFQVLNWACIRGNIALPRVYVHPISVVIDIRLTPSSISRWRCKVHLVMREFSGKMINPWTPDLKQL